MLYLTCTRICSVDLAHYGEPCANDWVSVDCDTRGEAHGQVGREAQLWCRRPLVPTAVQSAGTWNIQPSSKWICFLNQEMIRQ